MTSNRLKHLAKLRLILSVIALLLAAAMIVSGVMLFIVPKPEPPTEVPPQYEGGTTIIPLKPKITEATEAPTEAAETAKTMEKAENVRTEENGIRKNFYEHPVEHAVLMSKTL